MIYTPTKINDPGGAEYTVRLLAADDATRLGDYFVSLSAETRRRYGPHPFDYPTAADFCANLKPAETQRYVALNAEDQIIAYMILQMSVGEGEIKRYAAQGIALDSGRDCLLAPSLADAYQNRGIGTPIARQVIASAQGQGRRYLVLMGGVRAYNALGIRFYQKLGFQHVCDFEHPAGVMNHDMKLDL
jgi:ribosomal protein S18 acetylase RimI-like enzyme